MRANLREASPGLTKALLWLSVLVAFVAADPSAANSMLGLSQSAHIFTAVH
jgi:hypothetical protein